MFKKQITKQIAIQFKHLKSTKKNNKVLFLIIFFPPHFCGRLQFLFVCHNLITIRVCRCVYLWC